MHWFPSSHAPVFLGWHLNGVGPLPPPAATLTTARRQGPPVGRRARGTRTAILAYVQKTLHLGALLHATQDGQSEYARDERSGLLVLALCLLRCNLAEELPQHQTCSLCAKPACCDFCPPRASHLTASLCKQRACPGTFQHFFWYFCQFGNMPQGRHNHTGIQTE